MLGRKAPVATTHSGMSPEDSRPANIAPDQITVLIVNYKTRDLTRRAIESFRQQYADVPLILIDNGSQDESTDFLREMEQRDSKVSVLINEHNRYHGPAMNQGITSAKTPYVFTLDSDAEVVAGGFLEQMADLFLDPQLYALGDLRYKNRFGYTYGYVTSDGYTSRAHPENRRRIPYAHPYAMLLDRAKYQRLHPFVHHGAPCIKNMRDAKKVGYLVRHFPIVRFVLHHFEGTSAQHGYGLRSRSQQIVEHVLTNVEGFVLRDPVLKVQHRADRRK
jgi:glycosyltransferase involved in cell wall biosynthesis